MFDAAWWASVSLAAGISAAAGFLLGRAGGRSVAPAKDLPLAASALFLKDLAARGVALDICQFVAEGEPVGDTLARCMPKTLEPDGLVCELLDSAASGVAGPGARILCFFAPQRVDGRKVNAFETVVASVDAVAEPPRMLLALPARLLTIARRRHARKRVNDQRFVRVRLWLAEPDVSPLHFPVAAPDIWINAYDEQHGEENAVTNISAGGLALEMRTGLVPGKLRHGSPVVLKCSLFQFREKQFKPYWYAGLVRGLSTVGGPGGTLTRIAVGFTHVGAPDDMAPQGIAWTEKKMNEIQGDSR